MTKKLIFAVLFAGILRMGPGVAGAGPLTGHWPFDGNLRDLAGTANGTFAGGQASYQDGQIDQAIFLDGVDDFVNIPSPTNPSIYTIALWVKPASTAAASIVVRTSANGPTSEWSHQLRINTGGTFHHYLWVGAERNISGTTAVVPDTWYHVVIVARNNGPMRLYVNGKEDAASIGTAGTLWGSGDRIYVGSNSGHSMGWFKGLVDDLRIYNRELTAEQINGLFNGEAPAFVKAEAPSPVDGAVGVMMPLFQWTPGETAFFDAVYLGTTPELTEDDKVAQQMSVIKLYYHTKFPLLPGQTYYWRVDAIEADQTVHTGDVWSFTTAPATAFSPSPRDGDKWIDPNADLSWTPGQGAIEHHVYFGTDENAVASRDASVFKVKQVMTSYDPGTLDAETTYYWVVDEPGHPGEVWRFTTAGGGGGIKGEYFSNMNLTGAPALTRIDPSVDFDWGDAGPDASLPVDQFSARWTGDLEIAVADTYTFTANTDDGLRLWLDDEPMIDQWVDQSPTDASSAPIYLEPGIYSLRMEYYENGGGAVARLYWQTPSVARQIIPAGPLQPPIRARAIYPKDGDVDVPQDLALTWNAGEKAATHDVFFGDDADAVAAADTGSPEYQGRQAEATFALSGLEWGKTYYWRIDEVNTLDADSPWTGATWSFTTADFIVVDNFEGYSDDFENADAVWEVWIDGLTNLTGSIVGYFEAPFCEQTIVHSGNQSMPFDYNNIVSPYYSEAELPLDPAQDWTVEGVSDLSLWVRGYPAPVPVDVTETAGQMTLTGDGTDIWGNSDEFTYAYKTLNGNGSIVARVVSNGTGTNAWAKGGVMIRDSLDGGSTHAMMVITGGDGNGASFQWRPVADNASSNSDAATPVAPPYWVMIERIGDGLTGYMSLDGGNWRLQGSTQYIAMSAPVYIGICVTSHAAGEDRTFEFDNIQTSGGVSGAWQGAIISAPRHNAAQNLYVFVEEGARQSPIAVNADAVTSADWVEWKIPLSTFDNVNLARIGRLYIGVGDEDNLTPDGAGLIFVDDIRVTKPEPPAN